MFSHHHFRASLQLRVIILGDKTQKNLYLEEGEVSEEGGEGKRKEHLLESARLH